MLAVHNHSELHASRHDHRQRRRRGDHEYDDHLQARGLLDGRATQDRAGHHAGMEMMQRTLQGGPKWERGVTVGT